MVDKQKLAQEALAKLEQLREQFSGFQKLCLASLHKIEADEFLNKELADEIASTLNNITGVQKQLSVIYNNLALGALPQTITAATDTVQAVQKDLALKASFFAAAAFFTSLHSQNINIEQVLMAQKAKLEAMELEGLSVQEVKEQLAPYVDFYNFYKGHHELLPAVSAQFDYTLIVAVLQEKTAFYVDEASTKAAVSEKKVDVAEKPTAVSEKTVVAVADNDNDTENSVAAKEQAALASVPAEIFSEIVIGPKIIRAVDKEKKQITASIADRELSKYQDFSLKALFDLSMGGIITPKWVFSCHGNLRGKSTEYSLQNYTFSLDKCQNLGYAVKYDCDSYGSFYAVTDRGFYACSTCMNKTISKKQMDSKLKNHAPLRKLLADESYGLIWLRLCIAEVICALKLENSVYGGEDLIDQNDGYWFSTIYVDRVPKISMLIIAFNFKTEAEVEAFRTIFMDNREKWQSAKAIIFISAHEANAKALISWLAEHTDEEFVQKYKCYYALAEKQLCCYADDHIVTDYKEFMEAGAEIAADTDNREAKTAQVLKKEQAATEQVSAVEQAVAEVKAPAAKQSVTKDNEAGAATEAGVKSLASAEQADTLAEDEQTKEELQQAEKDKYLATYKKILMTGKTYCATAYLKKLADIDASFKNEYLQLAYAVNDPLENCSYNSDQIVETYFADEHLYNSYYLVAAMLRNFYSNQCLYDYSMDTLMDYVAEDKLLLENDKLKHLVDILRMFKKDQHCGMAKYADYKKSDLAELQAKLELIAQKAAEQKKLAYEQSSKVAITNIRFAKTLEYLFKGNSDILTCLDAIIEKNCDKDTLEYLQQYVVDTFIKDDAALAVENINSYKVNCLIDEAWNIAGNKIRNKKATSKLVSGPRTNLQHRLEEIAMLICEYIAVAERITSADADDLGFPAYQKAYKETKKLFTDVIAAYETDLQNADADYGYKLVLVQTLKEISSKMDGEASSFIGRYFYLPFLGDDKIILNDNYQPEFRDIKELPAMSTLCRLEKHAFEGGAFYVDVQRRLEGLAENQTELIQNIISEDNYGSLRLLIGYLNEQKPGFAADFMQKNSIAVALEYAESQAKKEFEDFSDDLELYQSYGQIDNTEENKKEIILHTAAMLYEVARNDENYGFFKQLLLEFRNKIQQDATVQGDNLKRNLDIFLSVHQELKENAAASQLVSLIEQYVAKQKFASAEELLNRLENNDYDNLQELEVQDYLQDFLNHYNSYIKSVADNDKTLRAQIKTYKATNKDTRAAERLLNAWPKSNMDATDLRAEELLTALGFKVASVRKLAVVNNKFPNFAIKLEQAVGGRINNYNHPVPAFGSLGETDGFRMVYIFGSYDADRLVEIFNNIGDEIHTLVVLDCALKESVRRRLALLVKEKANGKIFAVLDRVVLKYLYDNCSEQTINKRLLHVIMPYAYYQPYVADSSKPMPTELFIGRKEELKQIKDVSGVNIVYGGRQLGKSALLMKAKKDIDKNESGDRAVYIDIKGLNYKDTAFKISEELVLAQILEQKDITDDWYQLSMSIRMRLADEAKPIHYFLLLLDEADAFLDSCKEVRYKPFDALKNIQAVGEGRFKFVVAGLRDVVRFDHQIALNDNSVLPQLSSLTVKPFKFAEAKELLEYPLSYLGFRFRDDVETDTLVSAILSHTNSFPGMIQLYCTKLIETMKNGYAGYKEADTPPYYVSEEHIKKVLGEKHLQNEIRQKFFITLTVGSDNYYLLIAMITAYLYNTDEVGISVTPDAVLAFAKDFEIKDIAKLNLEKVTALMEEMRELNVLQHNGEHGYRFTHFSFFQMMGTKAALEKELSKHMGDSIDD